MIDFWSKDTSLEDKIGIRQDLFKYAMESNSSRHVLSWKGLYNQLTRLDVLMKEVGCDNSDSSEE